MAQDDEVHGLPIFEEISGEFGLCGCGPRHQVLVASPACQVLGQPPHHPESQIRVDQPECARRERVTGYAVHHTSRFVEFNQPVAVGDPGRPSGQAQLCGLAKVLCVKLALPETSSPAIMVSARDCQVNASLSDAYQGCQGGKDRSWNNRPVREPKLEQVSVDEQMVAVVGQCL